MKKLLSCVLSFTLLFTSVAPSFAQGLQTPKVGFRVSGSNSIEDAVTRNMARSFQQTEDAWWVEQGEKLLVKKYRIVHLSDIITDLFNAQKKAPQEDILQAVVCDKDNMSCVPALAYAWGGIHYATKNLLYHQDKPIIETAPQLATLITEYGLYGEADRQAVRMYFYKLVKEADKDCDSGLLQSKWEVGSQERRTNASQANSEQAKRCKAEVAVLPALAMLEQTNVEKAEATQKIYSLLKNRYDNEQGAEVIYSAVTALGVIGTEAAYKDLEHFVTKETIPGVAGNIWEGIWSPGKTTAQNSLRGVSKIRGGNSRYLNRINEQFQCLDKDEAKRQGFDNTIWVSEGRQYPYGNILEEVGAFIGAQSAQNPHARALAKKLVQKANKAAQEKTNAAGSIHYPVILGILTGWKKHGKQFIYEPSPELLTLFYKGDWFDINEGTQRRVHEYAYQFAHARGYTGWKSPEYDEQKNSRYIYNARLLGIGQAMDVVAPLFVAEGLFRVIPALAKGIPSAVRTLKLRSNNLVGTRNYLQRVPRNTLSKLNTPAAKELPLKPAQAVKPAVAKSGNSYTTVDMGVQNGQRTVAIATTPEQKATLLAQRTNIAPKTYASTGDGFTHTGATQPVMDEAASAAAAAGEPATAVSAAPTTPRWIEVETTNSLGNKVMTWEPNPAHSEYNQIVAELAGKTSGARPLSWWDNVQLNFALNFKPALQNMLKFGTSRYGLAGLGTGAAPLSSEGAVTMARAADAPAVVQTIRAQQGMFITDEVLRGGAGASYRTGAVNPGGIASQQFASQMLGTATKPTLAGMGYLTPTTLNAVRPWVKTAALVPAGLLGASLLFGSDVGVTEGLQATLAMSPILASPSSWHNWFQKKKNSPKDVITNPTKKDIAAANKFAETVLNQASPLATQLVAILQTVASAELKQQALVRLYKMGKLTKILQNALPAGAMQAVVELGRSEHTTALGKRLYSLYEEQLISEGIDAITDTAEQGALLKELADVVSAPGFASQSRALWESANQIPVLSVEDIGTTSFVPEADLEMVYSAFRTEPDFVKTHIHAQDKGTLVHYDNHIPFYYRDSHGNLSEEPVGILTQNQPGWYSRFLSHMPLYFTLPKIYQPSTWFRRDAWKLNYMADKSGLDIPKGFVLALDENGQWKFLKQDRALAESNPVSKKLLQEIETKGSIQVGLETPYTTADLLAMAKMLEKKTQAQRAGKLTSPLSFELALNSADSFKQMLKVWGFYVGLDTGASLSGPFKDAAKELKKAIHAVSNLVGGLGYVSPFVAAFTSRWMREWGLKASMFGLFTLAGLGLGYSLGWLGMTGFDKPEELGLAPQTIPFITAIFTGSLFGVLQPLVLNHYKNPVARTAANLEFSTTKQKARMMLTFATFLFGLKALGDLEWTLAIPVAFGLLGISFMLFLNTPLVRSAAPMNVASNNPEVKRLLASVKKQEKPKMSKQEKKQETKEFAKDYNQTFSKSKTVREIRDRVANVYAGYAPLMALVSQVVNAEGTLPLIGGEKIGQLVMVAFMYSAYRMRKWATNAVKSNRYTDDQLTGLSLPVLAATSAFIMFMPFNSIYALATAVMVAGLYVGTAVPGQLDNTRMQNIVSEEMQSRKQAVQNNQNLSPEERAKQLAKLERQEKDWAFRATRDYSYYNSVGFLGVLAATLLAYVLGDKALAPSFLQSIQIYNEDPVFTMDRLIFGISTLVLGALSWRHWNLTTDYWRARHPVQITEENIQAGNVQAEAFGISQGNIGANMGKLNKTLKDLQKLSIEYGLSSEKKMTDMLNKMVTVYNRLVAIKEVKGTLDESLQGSFNTLLGLARDYQKALEYNNLSVMLNREFDRFRLALSKEGNLEELAENMPYLEEGAYSLPQGHTKFVEAKDLIQKDLFQLAHRILNGSDVDARTYRLFIEYQNRAMIDLQQYTELNVADSKRALDLKRELNGICLTLKKADDMSGVLEKNAGPTSPKDIQALRDMLAGFPYEGENFR